MIDFGSIITSWPFLLQGALLTIQIAIFSSTIGFMLGTILGFAHTYASVLIQWIITLYVTVLRGTPMLIQISFAYYVLPELGLRISPFATAVIAIGLNSSAYISQIIKSGIKSVSKGQLEAAQVLGMTKLQTMRYITLPQALVLVIPALVNEFITLIKDSSLASIIGVPELFKKGNGIATATFNVIPVYCAMAAIYLLLTTVLAYVVSIIERKMNTDVTD
jgi:arginine/lysine/histidine transport system permease protein